MKKSILVILFIAFSAITFQSCKNNVNFKVGMTVAAKWTLKAGNKVLAVWAGSKFYSGTIKEIKENGAVITWDDGTADSEVAFGKILKTE